MRALALAVTGLAATSTATRSDKKANLRNGRRKLSESIDLHKLEHDALVGGLGSKIFFKVSADSSSSKRRINTLARGVAKDLDCESSEATRVFRPAGKHEADHAASGLNLWYQVDCSSKDVTLVEGDKARKIATSQKTLSAVKKYIADHDSTTDVVEVISPELEHKFEWQPNDPQLGMQPHYDNIKMGAAWDKVKGDKDIVVQVLDTGIDMQHPDLQQNIWRNEGEICNNGKDDDDNGFVDDCYGYNHADDTGTDLLGDHWHGTHCGGTIAADSNNGVGVAGVAGGDGTPDSGVKLMISVGFGDWGVGGFAEALVYGADNGAHVSSNSWGYTAPGMFDPAELAAIDYYNEKNGLVVFAAGNSNSQNDYYPGFYPGAVAVAATDSNDVRAGFSNYGDWIDISAPGVNVYSTLTHGQDYGFASGTSMACPHVAGVLALGRAVDEDAPREDVLQCMYDTAVNIDDQNGGFVGKLGHGLVDAEAFLECVANGSPTERPTLSKQPTRAPTTAEPTHSKPPTGSCDCDQTLTIHFVSDGFPWETAWTLTMDENAPDTCVRTDVESPYYEEPFHDYGEHVIGDQICAGQEYTFEIVDGWGDGICCLNGDGKYELKLNGKPIKHGGEFGDGESFTFVAPEDGGDFEPPTSTTTTEPVGEDPPGECEWRFKNDRKDLPCEANGMGRCTSCDGDLKACMKHQESKGYDFVVWWQNKCYGSNSCDNPYKLPNTDVYEYVCGDPPPEDSKPTYAPTMVVPPEDVKPTVAPTMAPTCEDNEDWVSGTGKGCPWVAQNAKLRCSSAVPGLRKNDRKKLMAGGAIEKSHKIQIPAAFGCPKTCGMCEDPEEPPEDPDEPVDCASLGCDQVLEVSIRTDDFPWETSWTLKMENAEDPRYEACSNPRYSPEYKRPNFDYGLKTVSKVICADQKYTFNITDEFGDGMCCDHGEGSFVLKLNGAPVDVGGEFAQSDVISFVAPPFVPDPVPTMEPTASCFTDPDWRRFNSKKGKEINSHDCDWFERQNPTNRMCKRVVNGQGVPAMEACQCACEAFL